MNFIVNISKSWYVEFLILVSLLNSGIVTIKSPRLIVAVPVILSTSGSFFAFGFIIVRVLVAGPCLMVLKDFFSGSSIFGGVNFIFAL